MDLKLWSLFNSNSYSVLEEPFFTAVSSIQMETLFFLELPAEFRSACSSANLCANYMEVERKLFLPTWRLENHKLHQQYSSGNSFKFASFNFHFNPFWNMFYLTISKLVTHCIHLNCNYVENCKHLFKFFYSFLFLL